MFTGIIEELGTVESLDLLDGDAARLTIRGEKVTEDAAHGASIAVNGCCLTAIAVAGADFTCELTGETLARTAFGDRLRAGTLVNLERPLRADGRLDGHIVQGHVDGVGTIEELRVLGTSAELVVAPPGSLERYLVEKGSVAVDGISLTVATLGPGRFTVAIIPFTLERTNLRAARAGDRVNLEADVVAKYVERLVLPLTARPGGTAGPKTG